MVSSQSPRKVPHAPFFAIFVSALFLMGLLASLQVAEPVSAQTPAASLQVTLRDYRTPLTGGVLFGDDAVAYLVLRDPARDTTAQRDLVVDVEVTSGSEKILIDLLEDGPRSGVFLGQFEFKPGPGSMPPSVDAFLGKVGFPNLGALGATSGADVRAAVPSGPSASFKWQSATDAAITVQSGITPLSNVPGVSHTITGHASGVIIQVVDADLNKQTATAETYAELLKAYSDSNPQGEFIPLTETATAGTFTGTVLFESTNGANNGRLFVKSKDRVWVTFEEPADAQGRSRVHHQPALDQDDNRWRFDPAGSGSIFVDRPIDGGRATYFGTTGSSTALDRPNGLNRMIVTVADLDRDSTSGPETVDVTVKAGAETCTLRTREVAGRSGFFLGTVEFTTTPGQACTSTAPGNTIRLLVANNIQITLSYQDGATERTFANTIVWRETTTATIIPTLPPENGGVFVGTRNYQIVLDDRDSNRRGDLAETVTIRARSSADPTGSATITLAETLVDSGLFTGTLTFTTGPSTANALGVADRAQVILEYDDPSDANGRPRLVRSFPPGAIENTPIIWRAAAAATISTDAAKYYKQTATNGDVVTQAHILVVDPDRNNPHKADQITVTATTIESSPKTTNIVLTEIGVDSGVFDGVLGFKVDAGGTSGEPNPLQVAPGVTQFEISYVDPAGASGGTQQISTGQLSFVTSVTGTEPRPVRLESGEAVPAVIKAVIYAPPASTNAAAATQSVHIVTYTDGSGGGTVQVDSNLCSPKNVPLNQGTLERRFATITLRTFDAASSCTTGDTMPLGISQTDQLKITLSTGTSTIETTVPIRPVTATSISLTDAGGTVLPKTSGTGKPVFIEVSDVKRNLDPNVRDRLVVSAQGQTGTAVSVSLIETGPDTGRFSAGVLPTTDVGSAGTRTVQVRAIAPGSAYSPSGLVTAGYGVSDFIAATYGSSTASARWFPVQTATFDAVADGTGTGGFSLALSDNDGLSGRIFEPRTSLASGATYAFNGGDYIKGSEQIFVAREVQQDFATTGTLTVDLAAGQAADAAEWITDRSNSGAPDCKDLGLTGQAIPLGGSPTATPISCQSMGPAAAPSTVTVTFATCTPSAVNTCRAIVNHQYRATHVNLCPTVATEQNPFEYQRTTTGIRFCSNPPVGSAMLFEYAKEKRTVSASVPGGETESVALTWVPSETKFKGTLPTEATATAGNAKLHVGSSATRVSILYGDPELAFDSGSGAGTATHFRRTHAFADWRPGQDGTIAFFTGDLTTPASGTVFGPAIGFTVTDRDQDVTTQQDAITISVARADGNDPESVVLRETGATSGIFQGVIALSAGSAQANDGTLQVGASSGTVRVTYFDRAGSTGAALIRTAEIPWRTSEDGRPKLFVEDFSVGQAVPSMKPVGASARLFVEIQDADRNQDSSAIETVVAKLVSDSDRTGEAIQLAETGPNTGEFRSSGILLEPNAIAANGRVFAREWDGDQVWAEYSDPLDASGFARHFRSPFTTWDERYDATTRLDSPFYIGTSTTTDGSFAQAHVTVADGDRNVFPSTIEQFSDSLTFGTASKMITFTETGANTGIFIGRFGFKHSASDPDTPVPKIVIANTPGGVDFTSIFSDATPADGSSTAKTFEASSRWFPDNHGIVALDRSGYNDATVPVRVTLYDGNAPTTRSVVVRSSSTSATLTLEGTGLKLLRSGVWEGSFTLSTSAASSNLHVALSDTIEARYDDTSPSGVRTASAIVSIGDKTAPTTTLTTNPANGAGENGWFLTTPTVSFTTDKPVQDTFYKIGGAAQPSLYTTPFTLTEGVHEFQFWSEDLFDPPNVETPKTKTIRVDLNDPTGVVTNPTATSRPAGAIELKWTATSDKAPLNFGSYKIYRGAAQASNLVGNSTTETFTDTPPADGSFTYYVAVADSSGRVNLAGAVSKSGVSDRVAPRLESFAVTPTTVSQAAGQTSVAMTANVVTADLPDTQGVHLKVTDPFGVVAAPVNLTRSGTTNTWTGTFSGFQACGIHRLFGAAFDTAGNEGGRTANVTYEAIDRDAPLVLVSTVNVDQGTPISVNVTENCRGIASLSYRIDGGSAQTVSVDGNPLRRDFTIDTASLSVGTHTLEVTASDANGTANTRTYPFSLIIVEAGTTPPPTDGTLPPPIIQPTSFLAEANGALSFRVGSGGPLTALTVSFDSGTPIVLLSSWANQASVIEASVANLQPGAHTATIVAANAGGASTRDVAFNVLPTGVPLPPANVVVQKGKDGFPQITWGASPSSSVGGYLIHRASSPSEVIADVGSDTGSYTDRTADAKTQYTYAVTAYGPNGEGKLDVGTLSSGLAWFDNVETQSFETDTDLGDGGFLASYWWVILIIAAVIVAVALAYVYRERIFGKGGQQEAFADEYPDEAGAAFGAQTHSLRCPNCTHEFSVSGQKPIVTTCPNCGKKGILR